jgi:hypothetical protein
VHNTRTERKQSGDLSNDYERLTTGGEWEKGKGSGSRNETLVRVAGDGVWAGTKVKPNFVGKKKKLRVVTNCHPTVYRVIPRATSEAPNPNLAPASRSPPFIPPFI